MIRISWKIRFKAFFGNIFGGNIWDLTEYKKLVKCMSERKSKELIEQLDLYRDVYDINIQMWDDVNIYVSRKDTNIEANVCSVGGYTHLEDALEAILNSLEEITKGNEYTE